jgi:peroxiredoxin
MHVGAFENTSQVLSEVVKIDPTTTIPAVNISPEVGASAPDFTLPTVNGLSVTLSNYRGKPVMLNFWDSKCEPCTREIPYLLAVSQEMAKEGLEFLTVSREGETNLKVFMQQEGYFFVVALDSDSTVWESYQIGDFPSTFFIDSDGIIQSIHVGAFENTSQVLSELATILED